MKYSNHKFPFLSLSLLLFALMLAGCSGGSYTGADPNPDPDPSPSSGISFDTGTITAGGSASVTFTEEGSVTYFCSFHPDMQGSITVSSEATNDGNITIAISNFSYGNPNITITPGTKVTWVNKDAVSHTATSE